MINDPTTQSLEASWEGSNIKKGPSSQKSYSLIPLIPICGKMLSNNVNCENCDIHGLWVRGSERTAGLMWPY